MDGSFHGTVPSLLKREAGFICGLTGLLRLQLAFTGGLPSMRP
uniref:Uncharacterized protein n=1 Tax=Anguilla anguilla TaxID=7936 RepID=A0A0E9QEP8_ANGAN